MKTVSNQFVLYGLKACKDIIDELIAELNIQYGSESYFEIRLLLIEALTNAFKHGNQSREDKPIYLKYTYNVNSIKFEIADSGNGITNVVIPDEISDERLLNDSGKGLYLIQCIADKITVKENTLIIEKTYKKKKVCSSSNLKMED